MRSLKLVTFVLTLAILLSCVLSVGAVGINSNVYDHGRMFNTSGFKSPVASKNGISYSYMYGKDGLFKPLDTFQSEWQMWTLGGASPAVGESAVAASDEYDGGIVFASDENCFVSIGSSMKIKVDDAQADNCDGVEFIVIQQRGNLFAPLWPVAGEFIWYNPKTQGKYILKNIETALNKGDKVLFVVRSIGTATGDTVAVDPSVKIIDKKVSSPNKFVEWSSAKGKGEISDGETFISSGYINDGAKNTIGTDSPFTYLYGADGRYDSYMPYRDTKGECIWKLDENTGAPWIGPWFFSASDSYDGVICFTAPKSGSYNVCNNQGDVLKIDTASGNSSDGLSFAVIAGNKEGKFSPLFPQRETWCWQTVNEGESIRFSPFSVYLNEGEKLYFIIHCKGNNINDVLIFDPKIVYTCATSEGIIGYSDWDEMIDSAVSQSDTVRLCDYFNNKYPPQKPISFMSGWNYEYKLLDAFRADWGCWTVSGGGAAIGAKWLGAINREEAVICYEAPTQGQVTVGSDIPLTLDFPDKSDGAQVLIYVSNYLGERPIWPVNGEWEYQKIIGTSKTELKDLKVNVKEGDKIYIVCRTMGETSYDTVDIAPYFILDKTVTGEIPQPVERLDPTDDTYMSKLPDPVGLELAMPKSEEESFVQKYLYLIIAVPSAVILIGLATVTVIVFKKKKGKKNGI